MKNIYKIDFQILKIYKMMTEVTEKLIILKLINWNLSRPIFKVSKHQYHHQQ